jgi:hypothetical protein
MEHNKAPGQDGFLIELDHNFSKIIKEDLVVLFGALHAGKLEIFLP